MFSYTEAMIQVVIPIFVDSHSKGILLLNKLNKGGVRVLSEEDQALINVVGWSDHIFMVSCQLPYQSQDPSLLFK